MFNHSQPTPSDCHPKTFYDNGLVLVLVILKTSSTICLKRARPYVCPSVMARLLVLFFHEHFSIEMTGVERCQSEIARFVRAGDQIEAVVF